MAKRFDDDYVGGFQKIKSHKNNKHKGHQSRRGLGEAERWDRMMGEDETFTPIIQTPIIQTPAYDYKDLVFDRPLVSSEAKVTVENVRGHTFGPNTRTIKGVQIDMDGVDSMEKIDNIKDGVMTYGIKFVFKGKKGLSRIVWFNTNKIVRNTTYDAEYNFWKGLSH